MEPCPKCGKPMRIVRESGKRLWRCPDWYGLGTRSCLTSVPIPDDEIIRISDMAEDLARESFSSSDEQAKKQASYRRIAGGLSNCVGNRYLSPAEECTLKEAANILQRLGSAAEQAKKQKKRLEEEERQRVDARRRETWGLIQTVFDTTDVIELAINTLLLAKLNNLHAPLRPGVVSRLRSLQTSRKTGLMKELESEIRMEFKIQLESLADSISWRDAPVAELIEKAKTAFADARDDVIGCNSTVIEELRKAVAIEMDPKIVVLAGRK